MQFFSTILFFNGNPVGYKISQQENNQLSINPAEHTGRTTTVPSLRATYIDGTWQVQGTDDLEVINQVVEDLRQNAPLLTNALSASP